MQPVVHTISNRLTFRAPLGSDVVLNFLSFETECTYDTVFVYDGAGADAPLLLSASGSTLPGEVTALSGTVNAEPRCAFCYARCKIH